jgi:hypothetical protein
MLYINPVAKSGEDGLTRYSLRDDPFLVMNQQI